MGNYTISIITSKEIWEDFNLSRNPQSFLQSWSWGEVNRLSGNKIFRFGIYKNSRLVGLCQLIEQKAKRGLHYICPAGPVIDWEDATQVEFVFNFLKKFAQEKKAWFVRIRPELKEKTAPIKLIRSVGLRDAPMHLHGENTLVLDIRPDLDIILANMRKNTRYLIKKAMKEGYLFSSSTKLADIKHLILLQDETAKRHRFVKFAAKDFQNEFSEFVKTQQISLCICRKGKNVLAAALVVYYKDMAYYHFSGSSNLARNSNANYFLQWMIIQEAKKKGCKYYDFWGIAPNLDSKHRFAGVTTFKRGFGGDQIDWLHAQDLPTNKLYWMTFFFENLRKRVRHL